MVFIDETKTAKGHCSHYSPWLQIVDYSSKRHEVFLERGIIRRVRNSIWQLSGGWQRSLEDTGPAENNGTQTGSDAYKALRVEARIKKSGMKRGDTRLVAEFDGETKEYLKSQANLDLMELPIFGFYDAPNTWYLATTRRIVSPAFKELHHIRYRDIADIGWSEGPNAPKVCLHEHVIYTQETRLCKSCLSTSSWFFVQTNLGQRFEMPIERYTSMHIWDFFNLLCRIETIYPA